MTAMNKLLRHGIFAALIFFSAASHSQQDRLQNWDYAASLLQLRDEHCWRSR